MFGANGYGVTRVLGAKASFGFQVIHRNGFAVTRGMSKIEATNISRNLNSDNPDWAALAAKV